MVPALIRPMKRAGAISQFLRIVSLLIVLFAVAFSLPSSAHANMMMQNGSHDQHMQDNKTDVTHSKTHHSNQVMGCDMMQESSGGGHDGAQCCLGICGDAVAATIGASFIADEVHQHVALPYLAMASAEPSHLIRPPNL